MYANNVRASIFMMLSMAGFVLNDSIIKSIDGELSTGQIILVRGLIASTLLFVLLWRQLHVQSKTATVFRWRHAAHPLVALRGLFDILATLAFLTALVHLPFANLMALLQALPLVVTLGAALFLGERVGWRRWAAITIGLLGVLIIVRPGLQGFSFYSLLALLAVLGSASRDLVTRRIPTHVPSLVVTFVTSIMVTSAGALAVLTVDSWQSMPPLLLAKLVGSALFIIVGYHCVILAMRIGEISFIAPFRYTGLLWAMVIGYWVFDEIPDLAMLAGSTIVIITGLYTFYRERRLAS